MISSFLLNIFVLTFTVLPKIEVINKRNKDSDRHVCVSTYTFKEIVF